MRKFSLDNKIFADILKHQAVHMDQAVCYCPEYLATRDMCYYPSRVAQIIRAVWLGELEPSQFGADLVFSSLLSGLGERWQNFGESPNGYLFSQILGRELFLKHGFYREDADKLLETIASQGDHILPIDAHERQLWKEAIPVEEDSNICLFVDDATYAFCSSSAIHLGDFLNSLDIQVHEDIGPYFGGFEYFAMGLVDKGIAHFQKLIDQLEEKGIRRVITLTGQSHFLLTTLCEAVGISHELEIINILELATEITASKVYLYGGSFYTRFLGMSDLLNELTENQEEKPIHNSCEFLPFVEGDKRVNTVTMWGMPVCSEFILGTGDDKLLSSIGAMAVTDIKKAGGKEIIVCDPHAYFKLHRLGNTAQYYLDYLR